VGGLHGSGVCAWVGAGLASGALEYVLLRFAIPVVIGGHSCLAVFSCRSGL
jgi:hypothetical protein